MLECRLLYGHQSWHSSTPAQLVSQAVILESIQTNRGRSSPRAAERLHSTFLTFGIATGANMKLILGLVRLKICAKLLG